ncbi:hypothetical protein MSG34_02560 [Vibrio sp. 1CM2L]|uniref:hypothetical protein n=1 Tax=Vibrio sp. 1CM2L TaxID=2929166 RepID=UPI0020C03E7B|nr:hypothetical protein [Vibrio sp. 1CM2L]MCK8075023.1 hypothetical protein [Vibrio sp. 1CM2L]
MGRGTLRTGCRNGARESLDIAGASISSNDGDARDIKPASFRGLLGQSCGSGDFFPPVVRMLFHSALAENTNAQTINGVNWFVGALSQNMRRDMQWQV